MAPPNRFPTHPRELRLKKRALRLEPLEGRRLLAVFSASNIGSLIADIASANSNGDASNTINLAAGTYTLNAGTGEILIQNSSATAHNKTLTIVGAGYDQSIIDGAGVTRVFELISSPGNATTVVMQHLAINGGWATDAGHLGGPDALGGGILMNGGNLTLSNVAMGSNAALGAAGDDGAPGVTDGGNGADGKNASGGAIYVAAGTLTIKANSYIHDNFAQGGSGGEGAIGNFFGSSAAWGLNGSQGANGAAGQDMGGVHSAHGGNGVRGQNGTPGGTGGVATAQPGRGGDGGNGGDASGGGIYVAGGQLSLQDSLVVHNSTFAGPGGRGGEGAGGYFLNGGAGGAGSRGRWWWMRPKRSASRFQSSARTPSSTRWARAACVWWSRMCAAAG